MSETSQGPTVLSLEEKRRLLVQKLQKKAERGNTFPLSFAQQRLWVVHQMDPGSAAYNMPYALRLRGALEMRVLGRALTALVRRHESLRTVFPAEEGVPVQLVRPAAPVVPLEIDLRHLEPGVRERETARLSGEEAARPFDLAAGPLLRVTVLRLADDDAVVLFTLHHIVGDGWSQDVLVRDLSALYTAAAEGREAVLPALPIQYADHAAWQRGWLTGDTLEAHLAYWRRRLAGAPPLLELPTDRPRTAAATARAETRSFVLPAETSESLRALSRSQGGTLFMTLLAAFQVVLARWSGQDDVVVGTPVAGRSRLEVENLIGFFVNMLPVRTELSDDPTFRALVNRVREGVLEAHAHQDLPFEKLVDEIQPERSLTHLPVFQVSFSLQAPAQESLRLGGLDAAPAGAGLQQAKFDLSLNMAERGGQVAASLTYRADLFDGGTVERMARHLERLLVRVADDADVSVSALDLLDAGEREQVVHGWNATKAALPLDTCVHALFEAQVERTPGAAALLWGDETVSYRALDAEANRVARLLRQRGIGVEDRVALYMEPGPRTVAALLGVLKAGAMFVPLDVASPRDRLEFVVRDSAVRLVLTQPERADGLAGIGADVLPLDDAALASVTDEAVEGGADPRSAAYMIYTSGSTGRPKGVVVPHRAAANMTGASMALAGFGPGVRALLFAPLHFDASLADLFPALCSGATLVLAPREALLPGPDLVALLERHGVTHAKMTPTALSALPHADLPGLRVVSVGGEACPQSLVDRWAPGRTFLNVYGPTETTVRVTALECRAGGAPSIGRPIANVQAYVLDGALRPVPVGVPGELLIGGEAVSRGYWGHPALTADRFVPDALGAAPGARLYRTGDKVRWLADGTLEYLGRLDEQVKIRGFRIEPGEVEAALAQHAGVRECAVIAREDVPGTRRLVAYVVGGADADDLRTHLRRTLPEYMVPAAFVPLHALPRTPNGKLDRRALPAPAYGAADDRHVEPRTEVERTLAGLWAEVLRLDRVGVHDSFFEVGGDSILAIQVVSRARRAGLQLSPRQLFEHQTIAELAAVVGQGQDASAPAAEQGRVDGVVAPTPVQAAFLERGHGTPAHYNQSVLLEVDESVSGEALERALAAVLAHHDALRLRVRRTESGRELAHGADAGIALERVDLAALPADEQDRVQGETAQARQASLHLEHGPLGRAVLFDRGGRGRVLLLVLHHLVVDGVSWRILREDLEHACDLAGRGAPLDLGAKSTSFRQWSQALQAYAAGDALRAEAGYWLAQGTDGVAPLPVDGEGGDTVADARSVTLGLDAEETRALLQDVPAAYRTQINDVLLAALAEVVGGWTGSPRIRLALEGHGREEEIVGGVDLTRTVGWFTSVYPVVLDVAGADGPGGRLKAVKEQLRAIPGRGIGYGVLRWMSPDEDVRGALAAQAEPEIVFNYLGQFDQGTGPSSRLRFAAGPRGREQADDTRRAHRLSVGGAIAGGCLQVSWTYGEGTHARETIERLAHAYLDALRALVAHCREDGAGGYTPSDFPLADVSQAELDGALDGRRDVEDLYPLSPLQEGLLFHSLYGDESQAYQVQVALRLEGALDVALLRRAWDGVVARHAVLRTGFVWEGVPRPLQRVHASAQVPWTLDDWRTLDDEAQEAALERFLAEDRARGFFAGRAAPAALRPVPGRGRRALVRVEPAPPAHGRVVRLAPDGRGVPPVRRVDGRRDGGAAARAAVPRLHRLAAAAGPRGRRALLARRPGGLRRAHPAAPGPPGGGRRGAAPGQAHPLPLRRADAPAGRGGPAAPAHPEHPAAGRVGAAAGPLQRRGGRGLRHHRLGPSHGPGGGGGDGGPLHQHAPRAHAGAGRRAGGRLAGGAAAGPGGDARVRVRAPGAGAGVRGRAAGHAALREPLHLRELPRRAQRRGRVPGRAHHPGPRGGVEHVSALAAGRARRAAAPGPELRREPLRRGHHRAHAGARGAGAGAARGRGRPAPGGAGAHRRRGAPPVRGRVERQRRGLPRRGVHPPPVRGAGGARAGGRGRHLRRRVADLRRAGRAGQPARPPPRPPGREARGARGAVPGARPGDDGGHPGGDEGRRRLRPRGPRPPRGAHRLRAGGLAGRRHAHAGAAAGPLSRGDGRADALRGPHVAGGGRRPRPSARDRRHEREPLLRHLHLRIDGPAQGRGHAPPGRRQLHRLGDPLLRGGPGERLARLLVHGGGPDHHQPAGALRRQAGALPPRGERRRGPRGSAVGRHGVRAIKITPVHLALLTPLLTPEVARRAAHTLVIGADFLPAEPTVFWQDHAPGVRLMNEYGPTETVVGCSAYVLPNGVHRNGAVPVGGAIQNLKFYVLDAAMRPMPVGMPGELYIGGAGVARGYLGRPALSAEKFVPDPFARAGERMYRTGDRARWLEGGNLPSWAAPTTR